MCLSPIQLDVFLADTQHGPLLSAVNAARPVRTRQPREERGQLAFRGQMMVETYPNESKTITASMKLAGVKSDAYFFPNRLSIASDLHGQTSPL